MKMTKIEFWRKVKENCEDRDSNGGVCWGSPCEICPYNLTEDCTQCALKSTGINRFNKKETLAFAEAYIKRHESKSKKKPKTVGIDNSDVTIATVKKNLTVPSNSEMPQPIKFDDPVPEYVYVVDASMICCYLVKGGFKKVMDIS